jgi:hypothetical protein
VHPIHFASTLIVVVMDPEVDFKDCRGDMKRAIIIHAVCDVSNNNTEVSGSKIRAIILQFFHTYQNTI